ncbi:hypothetical protein JYK14_24460 [Siccirubricoccus sp. KC 17139]|uniref:LysR substrate-binding domain-containing protein n=1 Tax=Siccirubricoccus soli TaxID=2899147 RepID=A0ABT1DBH4_9PROT|nr:hypothetical protein [Siccirubricoccus soli]MCO6419288.1 hypothetical protein [Siccirubricoccus soli]MCP2685423.1 hypothetical protein [Siccirubricoccus soli]
MGVLVFSSSTRYTADFLDRRIDEAIQKAEKNVVHFRHKQYEVKPQSTDRTSSKTFRLLVGTTDYPSRILADWETEADLPEGAHVEKVPERYRVDFQRDPDAALRDICGIASASLLPFIGQRHKILAAVSRGAEPEHRLLPWTGRTVWELANSEQGMPQIIVDNLGPKAARELPHFAHVDLSISGDRCGGALARQNGTSVVENAPGVFSHAPFFEVPLAIALQPSTQRPAEVAAFVDMLMT